MIYAIFAVTLLSLVVLLISCGYQFVNYKGDSKAFMLFCLVIAGSLASAIVMMIIILFTGSYTLY